MLALCMDIAKLPLQTAECGIKPVKEYNYPGSFGLLSFPLFSLERLNELFCFLKERCYTNSQSVVERMVVSLVFISSTPLFFRKLRPML